MRDEATSGGSEAVLARLDNLHLRSRAVVEEIERVIAETRTWEDGLWSSPLEVRLFDDFQLTERAPRSVGEER